LCSETFGTSSTFLTTTWGFDSTFYSLEGGGGVSLVVELGRGNIPNLFIFLSHIILIAKSLPYNVILAACIQNKL